MNSFEILFEDQHLIVLSKPAGLLCQGEITGDQNLVDELRSYFGRNYVGLVHRLDRNTSGVMVVAKRSKSAQRLTDSLQSGKLFRSYLGWAIGHLERQVQWTHSLIKDEKKNRVHVSSKGEGKIAILSATPKKRVMWKNTPLTLIQYVLETGRSHQIRVQTAYEGYPLLGDQKYNPKSTAPHFPRVALHSFQIRFPHPMSQEILSFEAPLPEDLKAMSEI